MAVALLGELLRARRVELGLEQAELAKLVGVSQQTVSRWERGEALPRRGRIELLANALDVEAATIARYAGSLAATTGDDGPSFHHLYERVDGLSDIELALLVERAWSTLRARMGLGLTRACT